jgi:hypothetical protein
MEDRVSGSWEEDVQINFYPQLIIQKFQSNSTHLNTHPNYHKNYEFSFFPQSESAFLLLNQLHIYFSFSTSYSPLKSPHQFSCKTVLHTTHKEYPLSSCSPSLKPNHQNHSTITCKTTNQAKNRKIRKWTFWCPWNTMPLAALPQSWIRFFYFHPQKTFDIVFRSHKSFLFGKCGKREIVVVSCFLEHKSSLFVFLTST